MKKYFFTHFLLILLSINIHATDVLYIDENFIKHNTLNFIHHLEDQKNELTHKDMFLTNHFKKSQKLQIGEKKGPFWTKLEIKNSSKKVIELVLYNSLAGTNEIDVYIYKNSNLIKTHILGDLREQKLRETLSRYSMFKLSLKADEEVSIISKIKNYNVYNIGWIVKKNNDFIQEEFKKLFVFGILFGLCILFILYNILFYKVYKEKTYIVIALSVFSFSIFVYGFNGIFYMMDIGFNLKLITSLTWTATSISFILFIIFAYYFFDMKKKYPKLVYYLKFKIFVFLLILLITLYAINFNNEFLWITKFIFFFTIFNSISLFILAIYMYLKKEIGCKYYLFAQSILCLSLLIYILNHLSHISYNESNKYFFTISLIIDIIFLTIAQYIKSKKLHQELLKNKEILIEQSRFSSMGQAIGHITHQWKHPLTNLGTSFAMLEAVYSNKKELLIEKFEEEIPSIKDDIRFMKNTIDDFSLFYSSKVKKSDFIPSESITNIKKILNSKIILTNVQIEVKSNNIEYIFGFEYIFSNIMLILIDNSLDEFNEKADNKINIFIEKKSDTYSIYYEDNAGGIKIKPIEKVFEYNVSSKHNKRSSGIGLPIVKMLVEDRLNGKICIKNTNKGVSFNIDINS